MIRKLLIANRGEIACRIIRTARRMGIATVAVFSDVDRGAPHVRDADQAVRIGAAAAAQSYLDADAVLAAARRAGADAVHPGYGFLSENADFAAACVAAGLIFVGPPASAIHAMGDKARAKAIMAKAGVPMAPGYSGDDQSAPRLAEEATRLGYPVLLKATGGGGGRGMRRVDRAEDMAAALQSAVREAQSAFGDGSMLLEKLIENGRHIEFQIFADKAGGTIHLGERDCSTQRRHQKVIEEAPSSFLDPEMRQAMGAAAVEAARAIGYVGAGTVEFIVTEDRSFFFLEMNTRLQVEHPVTEMITGIDLVEWQLRIAAGDALPVPQEAIVASGHAIEARLYAEDPYAGFQPQTGTILHWRPEKLAGRDGIRIDAGILEGGTVSPFYDPMVAKVIARGADRDDAIDRLQRALHDLPLLGLTTNRAFLIDVLGSRAFADGAMTTRLIDRWVDDKATIACGPTARDEDFALAAAVLTKAGNGDWFRSTGVAQCPITLQCGDIERRMLVRFERGRLAGVAVADRTIEIDLDATSSREVQYDIDGVAGRATALFDGQRLWLDVDRRTLAFEEPDPLAAREKRDDPSVVTSPVAGLIRHVAVAAGDRIAAGETIAVVEAMKMETTLVARGAGVVRAVRIAVGDQVRAGAVVAEIEVDAGG